MNDKKTAARSLREELEELLTEEDLRRPMLRALVEKAISGDMKAFETVREILNESPGGECAGVTITLGAGVEELAR